MTLMTSLNLPEEVKKLNEEIEKKNNNHWRNIKLKMWWKFSSHWIASVVTIFLKFSPPFLCHCMRKITQNSFSD